MRCASATTTSPAQSDAGAMSPTAVVSMPVTASNEAAAARPGATALTDPLSFDAALIASSAPSRPPGR